MANKIIISGKRKSSIARASIQEGKGNVTVNRKDYENLGFFDKLRIREPIEIAKKVLGSFNFDISVTIKIVSCFNRVL